MSKVNYYTEKIREKLGKSEGEIFDRTLRLTKIPSISKTAGETAVAELIYEEIREWPYFQRHPHRLQKAFLEKDPHGRFNIIGLVKGEGGDNRRAVLYMGHYDTVDVGEYGDLQDKAFDPASLARAFAQREVPEAVQKDLESGQWLFGRGVLDMKAGVAVLMQLLKGAADNPAAFSGNLVLAVVADEEADSQGMIAAAKTLVELCAHEGLNLVGAINTDTVCQLREDEPDHRYMYLGTVGKIIPAVYVVGKSAHAGESLQGFDVNLLLSRLTCQIDASVALCDQWEGQVAAPPVSLKQADLKVHYNAQVPSEGYAYYNFINYRRSTRDTVTLMVREVENAFRFCLEKMEAANRGYALAVGAPTPPLHLTPRVMTYESLYAEVCGKMGTTVVKARLDEVRETMEKRGGAVELRELTLELVRLLWRLSGLRGPAAVVFVMPPYYPPNNPGFDHETFVRFNQKTAAMAEDFKATKPYTIVVRPFFPILSDASFCAWQEGSAGREALAGNMPCWGRGWKIDIENVSRINVPVLHMGTHGKDPHKLYERLHVPYAMETLPSLVRRMTKVLLTD